VTGVLGGLLHLPLVTELWSWLLIQSGSLFTATSIFAFTVAPEVSPRLAEILKPVAIVLAVIYGGSKVWSAGANLRERL
jgi:hypothetical protein